MDYIIAAHKQFDQTLWHLTVIAERAREGIVVLDLNGAIRFINAAWAAMHRYETREGLIGKHISAFHTEEQMKTDVIPFMEEAKRRGQLAGPVEHVRRNGTPFPTEMLMAVFKDDAGKAMGLIGFATDLTEHERAKDELKRYRDRLAELVEQQIDELKATNEYLQREIAQHEQAEQDLKRQTSELTTVNERHRNQISEQEQAKNELQEYQDRLEQRVKEQSDELTAASEQLQHEIAKRKQVEECLKQKADELKTASERLQGLINEMRARGPFSQAAVSEATGSRKTTASILVDVFRQNIALQKPELDDAAVNEGTI